MTWDEIVKQGYDQFVKRNEDLEYVTRCKDCEFYSEDEKWCRRLGLCGAFNGNDFCSHAEPKEVEE